jgi:signal transduction histidine kinase
LSVINDILDFSKVESGKMSLSAEEFHLKQCLDDTFTLFTAISRERRLEMEYAIDPALPKTVIGDMTRLRQVLVNVVGNAVKFTAEGGVYVQVYRKRHSGDDLEIEFVIRDTGIGIPLEKIGLLFEPFTQADSSTSRKFGGTGLGLAISKKLVELMGGAIRVEPAKGQGAVFIFHIRTKAVLPERKSGTEPNLLSG